MANKITIPALRSQITPLRIPEIDAYRNPYGTVVASAAELGKAVADADARAQRAAMIAAQMKQSAGPSQDDEAPADSPPPREAAPDYDWGLDHFPSFDDYLRRQADARRRERRASVWETLNDLADSAFKDPSRIGEYRDDADGVLDTLPEEEREDYAATRRRINEQYLRGLIRDNPKLALETLRSRAGAAEEDLGITEEMREDLEARAQRAFEAEQNRLELERQVSALDVAAWTKTYAKEAPREVWRAYADVIDAFDWDTESVHWLEPRVDKTVREVRAWTRTAVKTANKIIAGEPGSWDRSERVRALDTFARSVIGPDAWATPTRHRMAWLSRIANRAPDVVRGHIRTGVHSRDAGKRAFAGRLLLDLDEHLLTWATPDIRAFGFDFGALIGSGFSDHVAVARIDAARGLTPEQQEARRHSFYARLDGGALSDALQEILERDEDDLLYRPDSTGRNGTTWPTMSDLGRPAS